VLEIIRGRSNGTNNLPMTLSYLKAHFSGNWTTRGLPTRGLVKSQTGQLAVSQMPPKRKTKRAKSPMASATCPVRELSSPRVDQSARCPVRELTVRELAIRELSSNHFSWLKPLTLVSKEI